MSAQEEFRIAGRRAALRLALRRGDAVAAARAAARLRIPQARLSASELGRVRTARRALGIAILRARLPKRASTAPAAVAPVVTQRSDRRRLAAVAAVLAALLLAVLWPRDGDVGGGSPDAAAVAPQVVTIASVSRGRTVVAPLEVVVVQETPSPTPEATAEPSASPAPSVAAVTAKPGATSGTGTGTTEGGGGTGTGSGPGNGSGSGPGNGTRSATPAPTATPRVPPPGYVRFNIRVLDSRTYRPVADVCVIHGTRDCGSGDYTDKDGRWSWDVAASAYVTQWDITLIKDGYVTLQQHLVMPRGRSQYLFTIRYEKVR